MKVNNANGRMPKAKGRNRLTERRFLFPFILVTSLFFLWGCAHGILDVLNKHFQDALVISKARSGLIQGVLYGGYFLMALPAGWIIRKWGYRRGVVTGLFLYGIGALMFVPGEKIMSFSFFLLCLFVIGCGLTCLETSANPYITILGDPKDGPRRLNLAQSFNGLGWIFGPMIGSMLILGEESRLSLPYAVIGVIVLILGCVFCRLRLPEPIREASSKELERGLEPESASQKSLLNNGAFILGVLTLFLYVAAQTGINSFFINYVTEAIDGFSAQNAGLMLSFGGMGLFMVGRLCGSALMSKMAPGKLLAICASSAVLCMLLVIFGHGVLAVAALCLVYLFESIMFPTIFSMALLHAEGSTEKASSILIMSIVGGAVAPVVMGLMGRVYMALGFVVPLVCFAEILWYARVSSKLQRER